MIEIENMHRMDRMYKCYFPSYITSDPSVIHQIILYPVHNYLWNSLPQDVLTSKKDWTDFWKKCLSQVTGHDGYVKTSGSAIGLYLNARCKRGAWDKMCLIFLYAFGGHEIQKTGLDGCLA